jgi:hypothetical protein
MFGEHTCGSEGASGKPVSCLSLMSSHLKEVRQRMLRKSENNSEISLVVATLQQSRTAHLYTIFERNMVLLSGYLKMLSQHRSF